MGAVVDFFADVATSVLGIAVVAYVISVIIWFFKG